MSTITYNDYLIEYLRIRLKLNLLDNGTTADSNLAVFVAYITYHECCIGRSIQLEVSVNVGHASCLRAFHSDSCTNQRFTVLVNNLAADLDDLCLFH